MPTYKAITLTQPWATLVMLGRKRVETRPVLFSYRGQLFIHASRQIDDGAMRNEKIAAALVAAGLTSAMLPTGKVLGSVDVVNGCRFAVKPFPECLPPSWRGAVDSDEEFFGNFAPGRGGLLLGPPSHLLAPVPARGMNGLWNWTPSSPLEWRDGAG